MRNLLLIGFLTVPFVALAQSSDEQSFASAPIGQKDLLCTSDSGTEIKDEQTIRAPAGHYFVEVRPEEIVPTKSYALSAGQIGCVEIGQPEMVGMRVTVNGRPRTVQVPVTIRVLAHADCGSGLQPVISRWQITAYCRAAGIIAPIGR